MSIAYMTSYKLSPTRSMYGPITGGASHYSLYQQQKPSRSNTQTSYVKQLSFLSPPSSKANPLDMMASATSGTNQQPFFSAVNKISVISLERRIDYHLQRIMKQNRLINFKNSIEALPIEDRIAESLLEIIVSGELWCFSMAFLFHIENNLFVICSP